MLIKRRKIRRKSKSLLCLKCGHFEHRRCLIGRDLSQDGLKCNHILPKGEKHQLTSADVAIVRDNIAKANKFVCPICEKYMYSNEIVLDHHHKKRIKGTGLIRGSICRTCNVFIAKSENNAPRYRISKKELPHVLRRIADYIERPQYIYIHPSEKPKQPRLKKASYNKLVKADKENKNTFLKCPKLVPYPKSGKVTVPLKKLFDFYEIEPEFYSK